MVKEDETQDDIKMQISKLSEEALKIVKKGGK